MSTSSDTLNVATKASDHMMPGPLPVMSNGPALTPAGAPVPTPYAYISQSSTADQTESALEISGSPVLVVGSTMKIEQPGNAASQPTGGDVVTFAACNLTTMFEGSSVLKAGGQGVCRTKDRGYMNTATPGSKVAQCIGLLVEGIHIRSGFALKSDAAQFIGVIDPVSVSTGDVFDEDEDLHLLGLIPVSWKRLYLSSRDEDTPLGRGGWTHSLHQWVAAGEDHVVLRGEDGRDVRFAPLSPPAGAEQGRSRRPASLHRGRRLELSSPAEGVYEVLDLESRLTRHFRAGERGGRAMLRAIRDAWGNVVELVYEGARLARVAGPSGRQLVLSSDDRGRIIRVEAWSRGAPYRAVAYAYTAAGELESATDALGNVDRYAYDGHRRLVQKTLPTGARFHYVYDEAGRCVEGRGDRGIHPGALSYDLAKRTTTLSGTPSPRVYSWNERGAVTLERTSCGSVVKKTTYDDDLLVTSTEDAAGNKRQFEYDERGNLVAATEPDGQVTRRTYANDLLVQRIAPGGAATEMRYTPEGALASIVYPSGLGLSLTYDGRGRIAAIHDIDGLHAAFEYDEQDNVVCEVGSQGERSRFTYDPSGRVTTFTDPLGRTVTYAYDALGRPTGHLLPDGSRVIEEREPLGRVVRARDPLGATTSAEIGGTHSLVRKTMEDGSVWELEYDAMERLRSIKNPKQEVWEYRRDRAGRVREERTFDGRVLRYRYSRSGALSRIERMDGTHRAFVTDETGALVAETSPHGAFRIDASPGKIVATVDEAPGETVVTSELDALGRLVAETQDGLTIRYQYDDRNRRAVRVLPGGEVTRYRYDAAGFLVAVEHRGRVLSIVRDPTGNEVRRHLHWSGVDILSTVDAMDRVTSQRVLGPPRGGAARDTLVERAFTYDARGYPRSVADTLRGTLTFEHDRTGQLVRVERPGAREIIDHDAAGSVVGVRGDDGPAAPWTTRPGNVLVRAGAVFYDHDESRRRTRRAGPDGTTTYLWDCRDRLREVRLPDGRRVLHTYDVLGRRLRKEIVPAPPPGAQAPAAPVRTIRYLWDGPVLAAEIDSELGTRIFVHHPGSFTPLLQVERDDVLACVTDPLGAPRELIDERGEIVWAATCSAFGAVVAQPVSRPAGRARQPSCPFRLLGQFHDEETGLCYALMRYFDPATARWLSPDPLGMEGGRNPFSFNGSPAAHVDPMGLRCIIGVPAIDKAMEEALGVPPKPGYYDVVVHGTPYGVSIKDARGDVRPITPRQLALLIQRQKDYKGEKIRLMSCSTGAEDQGFAQQLAREMGKEVVAPTRDMSPHEADSPIMRPFSPTTPPPPRPPPVAPPALVTAPPPHVTGQGPLPMTPPGTTPAPPAMVPTTPAGGWPPPPAMVR